MLITGKTKTAKMNRVDPESFSGDSREWMLLLWDDRKTKRSLADFSMLYRKFGALLLFLLLIACGTPKAILDSTSIRIQSGPADKIHSLLEVLANQLPSNEAGIAIGYVDGEDTTIAFVGNSIFTEETLFEYASITKVLTANILVQLVHEGSLHLDDRLNEFLPEDIQDRQWEAVTLRHLATHTAGIADLPPSLSSVRLASPGIDPFANYDEAMLYQDIQATKVRSIGTWKYSNYGYALLGFVLRQQTNLEYADLVEQRIFEPLGMKNATIEGWSSGNIAPPLSPNGGSSNHWNYEAFASAGALRGNLLDGIALLKASMSACQSNDIVARSNCQTQQSTGIRIYNTSQMGLGWNRTPKNDELIIWKNGVSGGYSVFIGLNPEKDVGIVLLSNVKLFQPFFVDGAVVRFLLSVQ
jgi:CubicO group peptidase (beta-lactamase class C family)